MSFEEVQIPYEDDKPLLLRGGIEYTDYPGPFDNYIYEQIRPTPPNDNSLI